MTRRGRAPRADPPAHAAPPAASALPRGEHCQQVDGGCLESQQTLWTRAPGLVANDGRLAKQMRALHFGTVERSALGLLRCARVPGGVDCRLLGRWTALAFREEETLENPRRCVRRWQIAPGFLARRSQGRHGTLTLGAEMEPGTERDPVWRLWCSVEGYPSRFLRAPETPLCLPPGWVGRLYAGFHRLVASAYLRRLARHLRQPGRG